MQPQKAYCHNEEISLSSFYSDFQVEWFYERAWLHATSFCVSHQSVIILCITYFIDCFFCCTLHSTITFLSSFSLFLSWSTCAFITGAWPGYALPVQFSSVQDCIYALGKAHTCATLSAEVSPTLSVNHFQCLYDWLNCFLSYCSVGIYNIYASRTDTILW